MRHIGLYHFLEGNVQLYKPKPAPRKKKEQPVAAPKTKIGEKRRALKGFIKSYEFSTADHYLQIMKKRDEFALNNFFTNGAP